MNKINKKFSSKKLHKYLLSFLENYVTCAFSHLANFNVLALIDCEISAIWARSLILLKNMHTI